MGILSRRAKKTDALKGTLDLLILTSLRRGPDHGFGLATHLQTISDDALRVEEGSLYPALHRMEQSGWIVSDWQTTDNNRRARVYRLTRAGQRHLETEAATWRSLTVAVQKVLRAAEV